MHIYIPAPSPLPWSHGRSFKLLIRYFLIRSFLGYYPSILMRLRTNSTSLFLLVSFRPPSIFHASTILQYLELVLLCDLLLTASWKDILPRSFVERDDRRDRYPHRRQRHRYHTCISTRPHHRPIHHPRCGPSIR